MAAAAAAATLGLLLAACSNGSSGGSSGGSGQYGFTAAQQTGGAITVWVDSTRVPAVQAFEKAYPNVKVNLVTYDGAAGGSNSFEIKMDLFDKAGGGWPDVVFSSQTSDATWASQPDGQTQPFAAVLGHGLITPAVISGFTPGTLDVCTVDGKLYCLRNDVAPNVLWYNAALMKKFGYAVPTTWEQYEAIGKEVAAQHPGYIIGSVGDSFEGPEVYEWGSECQANDITGPKAVTVNVSTANCQRAAEMMDTLTADGALTQDSVFAPAFVQKYTGKVLMMPGPAWLSGSIFNGAELKVPAGQTGVAPPPSWGSAAPVTGDVGGGTWFISSHSKNLALDAKFLTFVATSPAYQVKLAPGLPAYASVQQQWLAAQEKSGYYATPLSALTTAAREIWPGWGSGQFSQETIWSKTILPAVAAGKQVAPMLPAWGTAIKDEAQTFGYSVSS